MGALSRIAGSGGVEIIATTVESTSKNYVQVVIQEDTVFTSMTGTDGNDAGSAVDFVSTMGISGLTLKQGLILTVPAGSKITNLKLASGSVAAYKASQQ